MRRQANESRTLLVGIDPDTKASGWAVIDLSNRTVHLETLPFMDILALLTEWRREVDDHYLDESYSYRFVVEDIWTVAHNWHVSARDNRQTISKKGYHIGRCSMVGQLIYEAIGAHFFPRIAQPPLRKVWRGIDGKISHPELLELCEKHDLILPPSKQKQTNQEERDALLLALHHIATPIKLFDQ
jgi:hypothetical protein